jgi:hypothetical protein
MKAGSTGSSWGRNNMGTDKSTPKRAVLGRYTEVHKARVPGGDLARPAPSVHIRTAIGAVPNPLDPTGKERIAVAINRRVDILEDELKQRLISEGAYRTGREIQKAFEVGIPSSSNWSDGGSGDPTTAQEMRQARMCDRAERAVALEADIRRLVGEKGAELIRKVLGEGWTYGQISIRDGKLGDRGRRQVAAEFRDVLEYVTEKRAAKGRAAS